MAFVALLLAAVFDFDKAPIAKDVELGKKVFAQHQGIDRTQKDARAVIGQWFDGDRTRVVEEVDFLTPGLLSRWLGYQTATGVPKSQIDSAWEHCSQQLNGRSLALIRLARLCKVDYIDGEVDGSGKPEALDQVQVFMREVGGEWQEVKLQVVQDIQARQPTEVLADTWDQVVAKFIAWPSEATHEDLMPDLRWGKNRRISYLADVPALGAGKKCECKIVEKDRIRTIPFDFPKS